MGLATVYGIVRQNGGFIEVGPIDLLVTDIIMPEMNGKDLAEKLRELLSRN